ncbi:MAG: HEPN domain-containing protein [Ignavibacteriales bacterium]|nr:HEPN domain-containing protein [Ignavibacteriales bacterium]
MNEDQKQLVIHRMEKAGNKIKAVELCYREKLVLEAGSNLYYSTLNSARALLAVIGKDSKSHQGFVHLLNENFIRTGMMVEAQEYLHNPVFRFQGIAHE